MASSSNNLRQQPIRFLLQCQYISPYLLQRTQGLGFVEVAVEAALPQ